MAQYFLVKQEPETYPWEQFVADGVTMWDGVRNYQARNNLRLMKKGDKVLFYASNGPKCVMGTATVERPAYPDPTAEKGDWSAVDLRAGRALKQPVTLATMKATPELEGLPLLRHTRLSVMPISREHYET
ncbi:MAG: EVE domain-containing protein, partial [Verrucomicrobia bacterium]